SHEDESRDHQNPDHRDLVRRRHHVGANMLTACAMSQPGATGAPTKSFRRFAGSGVKSRQAPPLRRNGRRHGLRTTTTTELNPMQSKNLKNIARTAFMAAIVGIACFLIWGFATSQAAEKVSGPMKGVFWRVDWSYMKDRRFGGAYLEDMKKNLPSN